jgi:glycyl-tRNA synthetase beta chain
VKEAVEYLVFAASHCKNDLVSELVFEFPELQGKIGGLLLRHAGSCESRWRSVYDQYRPQSLDDALPETPVGAWLSVADRMDTLVGCFAIGLMPTGTRDPLALRRAAQGVVKILLHYRMPLDLAAWVDASWASYQASGQRLDLSLDEVHASLSAFFRDRCRYVLQQQGEDLGAIDAVLDADGHALHQTLDKLQALKSKAQEEGFLSLVQNLKRLTNVIRDEEASLPGFDPLLLQEEAEQQLWQAFCTVKPKIEGALTQGDFHRAMDEMMTLSAPVAHYFSPQGVFVNAEDSSLRLNRKSMLCDIRDVLARLANFTRLDLKSNESNF